MSAFLFVCLSFRLVYPFTTSLLLSSPPPSQKRTKNKQNKTKQKKNCSNTLIFAHHSATQFHTTLPKVFNRDLALIQHPIRLHSSKDLAEIIKLAQDRKCWRGLQSLIEKAAEVSQTKNWDAKRQYVSQSITPIHWHIMSYNFNIRIITSLGLLAFKTSPSLPYRMGRPPR